MEEGNKPRTRARKIVDSSKGVQKKGEGLGIGPVNNAGNYADRAEQAPASGTSADGGAQESYSGASADGGPQPARPRPGFTVPDAGFSSADGGGIPTRPAGARPSASSSADGGGIPARPASVKPGASSSADGGGIPARPASARPSTASSADGGRTSERQAAQQPRQGGPRIHYGPDGQSSGGSAAQAAGNTAGRTAQQPSSAGNAANRATQQSSSGVNAAGLVSSLLGGATGNGGQNGGKKSGGGSRLILLLVAAAVLFFGGRSLFGGGNDGTDTSTSTNTNTNTSLFSGDTAGTGGLTNLLSGFMGSSGSSVYDLLGVLSQGTDASQGTGAYQGGSVLPQSLSQQGDVAQYFTSPDGGSTDNLDTPPVPGARTKRTVIRGGGKDTVTVMVYLCGSDLESRSGMGTSDLKEMTQAKLSDKVNLIVYTGGASSWKNSVVSSRTQQIYQIRDGGLYRLEENMGTTSMTDPETLAKFIRYGAKNFPADRMCLILWDHGGGSVSGYGRDEVKGAGSSMSLAGINTALKSGGVSFDFIGFDACLMATVENGIMLEKYADYMIASEETEPGVGWYYTDWLTKLSANTSMPTVEIGRQIADDFVNVCNRKCRGQATTLSVVELAELAATVPAELKEFSVETSEMIRSNQYSKVSTARSRTREFAQSSKIDQVDLVHFARNMETKEGEELAQALEGAVKYNRIGGGISNAYGLSIYFPYKRAGKVSQAVSAYQAIGMDDEYARCIQEFASLEVSGQVSAGTPADSYGSSQTVALPGLMSSLLGSGSYSSSAGSADLLDGLLGSLMGGSGGDALSFFSGRSMSLEDTRDYILAHHFDPSLLVWENDRISLPKEQWDLVENLCLNVFIDDGEGYMDLGMDLPAPDSISGGDLLAVYDGTWLAIDRQPVAYYYLGTVEEGENYATTGYIPAMLNGVRVNLILIFDSERPDGYLAGALPVYGDSEDEVQPKTMIGIGKGDQLQFLCDYYDYQGKYQDTYHLGDPITLGDEIEIANAPVDVSAAKVTWCFTDIYQQKYWTPSLTWKDR